MYKGATMMGSYEQTQVKVVQDLTANHLPMNDFGLPIGIFRVDLLPFDEYQDPNTRLIEPIAPAALVPIEGIAEDLLGGESPEEPQEIVVRRMAGLPSTGVHASFMELSYAQGYPTLDDGTPFWGRLFFEPPDAHAVFTRYLQMSQGIRSDSGNEDDALREGVSATGTRDILELAGQYHEDKNLLEAQQKYIVYSHLYYWGIRAKAYDFYKVAAHRKQQELRAIETQDEHYIDARRLMGKLHEFMNEDEDFWDMLTPKVAIDFYKTLTAQQRIAAGLPSAGPLGGGAGGRGGSGGTEQGTTMEIMVRNIAQQNNTSGVTIDSDSQSIMENAYDDPEVLEQLQELIIKINM